MNFNTAVILAIGEHFGVLRDLIEEDLEQPEEKEVFGETLDKPLQLNKKDN